jgi:hypothetical protein
MTHMYALITDPAGIIVEVVVLATRRNRMRIAAAGFPDAFELRLSGGRWLTESGEAVEFEFLASSAALGVDVSSSKEVPAACFAGAQAS